MFPIFFPPEKPERIEPEEGQYLCLVCGDLANGIHFGVYTCEGCKVRVERLNLHLWKYILCIKLVVFSRIYCNIEILDKLFFHIKCTNLNRKCICTFVVFVCD